MSSENVLDWTCGSKDLSLFVTQIWINLGYASIDRNYKINEINLIECVLRRPTSDSKLYSRRIVIILREFLKLSLNNKFFSNLFSMLSVAFFSLSQSFLFTALHVRGL